ncbi:MAG TPA: sulfur transferase domain-containing protein [Pyrinomonadaceae bacterium]|nr:sulfur transferase domain-containing protein [Pyrinomonadaceae bacterium]
MKFLRAKAGAPAGRPEAIRTLLVVLLSLAASLAATAQAPQAPQASPVSIRNFGQVNENYFRGSQPGAAELAELKRLGVRTIIDLRMDRLAGSEELARAQGFAYYHIPLTTKKPATGEQSDYFLRLVNDPANWPVYVHCKGGRHRTGQMTAIYRITGQGWTAEQAYEEMKRYDFEDSWFYPRVLKRHVFEFHRQFAAGRGARAGAKEM